MILKNKAIKTTTALALVSLLVAKILLSPIATDEAEHLHFAYLSYLGFEPYADFWQHHMPLTWYVLYPFLMISDPLSLFFSERLLSLILILVSVNLVISSVPKELSVWAGLLALATFIFPYERASLRPEILVLPIIALVVMKLNTNNLRSSSIFTSAILGIALTASFFVTPRAAPFVGVFAGYFFLDNLRDLKSLWTLAISAAVTTALFFYFFSLEDILFFVFQQSIEFQSRHNFYASKLYVFLSLLLSLVHLYVFKKDAARLFVLKMAAVLTFAQEAAPYFSQSTMFLTIMDFLLAIVIFQRIPTSKGIKNAVLLIPTTTVAAVSAQFLFLNFDDRKNIFSDASHTISYLETCQNRKIQTPSFSRNKSSKEYSRDIHPILALDASYFGFFQQSILTRSNIAKVHTHNRNMGRRVNYLATNDEICFFNPTVRDILYESRP